MFVRQKGFAIQTPLSAGPASLGAVRRPLHQGRWQHDSGAQGRCDEVLDVRRAVARGPVCCHIHKRRRQHIDNIEALLAALRHAGIELDRRAVLLDGHNRLLRAMLVPSRQRLPQRCV